MEGNEMKLLTSILWSCILAGSYAASEHSQTQGNIAVHLISLETGRYLQPINDRPMIKTDGEYVVACYLVEYLGNNEIDHSHLDGLTYWKNDKVVDVSVPNSAGEMASSGITSRYNLIDVMCFYQNIDLSMVLDTNRTFLHRELWFGQFPEDISSVDIKISSGFNDEIHDFVFKDIPVGNSQSKSSTDKVKGS
jgi:hypothetical protein